MKIYYAHSIDIYKTSEEQEDIKRILSVFDGSEIYNPSEDENASEGYKEIGMIYFTNIVKKFDLLIFKSNKNNNITSGVKKEIDEAIKNSIPVLELPRYHGRVLSVESTRKYLRGEK